MRPGMGKRMRGRNRGGKGGGGGGNPMHRGFESNGPDVKIRGTAQHVAEKYAQLGRDAQASGDHVLAENYLQHAEHYFRMIAAYQAQFAPEGTQGNDAEADEGFDGDATGEDMGNQQQNFRGNFRNQRYQRPYHNRRPEETEQPPVAFPARDEQGSETRGNQERGPRRFDKRERFSRDRNQQGGGNQGGGNNDQAGGSGEELPPFLTRNRRRNRPEDETEADGANNNSVPPPPASEA